MVETVAFLNCVMPPQHLDLATFDSVGYVQCLIILVVIVVEALNVDVALHCDMVDPKPTAHQFVSNNFCHNRGHWWRTFKEARQSFLVCST
jgi:hypothetical protein